MGDDVEIAIDVDRLHWFDADSGDSIRS